MTTIQRPRVNLKRFSSRSVHHDPAARLVPHGRDAGIERTRVSNDNALRRNTQRLSSILYDLLDPLHLAGPGEYEIGCPVIAGT